MATRDTTPPCRLAALGLATEGAVRMAPVCGLPQLLRDHGLDADSVIRAQGCDPTLFSDPDNIIAFSAIGRLLVHIAEITRCAYPGLALGRQRGLDASGAVGRAVRLAPDVGTALRAFVLNMHLHDRGAVPYLLADSRKAMFGYTLYCAEVNGADHIYDAALAIAYNMIRELAGPGWQATEIRLFRKQPEDIKPFREHFKAALRFEAQQAAVVFPSADLKRPCVGADAEKYAKALADLKSLEDASGIGLADKVRRVLLSLFVTRVNVGAAAPDRTLVAELFSMHPRTLNRRLRAEGITLAALLAQARYDIARELLRDTRLPVQDIALILGYAGTAPFSCAFRRWSGTTAASWRALHGRT
jgi:AraC-like DNA-binding protein